MCAWNPKKLKCPCTWTWGASLFTCYLKVPSLIIYVEKFETPDGDVDKFNASRIVIENAFSLLKDR